MVSLENRECKPCEGGVDPLDPVRISILVEQIPGWAVTQDGRGIHRRLEFKGFYKTMGFINALAWLANRQGHHPDIRAGYNYCEVTWTTHAIEGLSENDFICAARVNTLLGENT